MDPNCVKTCATCRHDGKPMVTYPCHDCRQWDLFEPKGPQPVPMGEGVSYKTDGAGIRHPIPGTISALDVQVGGGHYKAKGIQPIAYIFANKLGFCEGNVVKYVTRYQDKNGVEDLKKARHYLDMLIEKLEKDA